MKKQFLTLPLLFGAILLSTANSANASASYSVSVNTSSLTGKTGSLDFQFNPGVGILQSATVMASGLTGGTYAGSQAVFGTGTSGGPIPAPISITNATGDNEVLDTFTFGNILTFNLLFSGPAVTSPNGSDTAGSSFAFYIYSDPAGTIPALTTSVSGASLTVNVNPNGSLSASVLSPNLQLVPEPSSAMLLGGSILLVALGALGRRLAIN